MKVNIGGHTRQKIVPKLLLQVSARKLHNILDSDPDYGGLKEAIYSENNIIISYSTLRSLFPPQLKNIITIQGHVWFWMLYLFQKYAFLITIMA